MDKVRDLEGYLWVSSQIWISHHKVSYLKWTLLAFQLVYMGLRIQFFYMITLANPNEEHEHWTCCYWSQSEYSAH